MSPISPTRFLYSPHLLDVWHFSSLFFRLWDSRPIPIGCDLRGGAAPSSPQGANPKKNGPRTVGNPKNKRAIFVEQNQKNICNDEVEQNPNIWEKLKEIRHQKKLKLLKLMSLRITLTRYKGTFFLRPYNPPRREREFPQKVVYTGGILPKMAEKLRWMIYTKLPYNTLE